MSGENLPLVGCLLAHKRHRNTAGYAHLANAPLVEAAEHIGSIIIRAMSGKEYAAVNTQPNAPIKVVQSRATV